MLRIDTGVQRTDHCYYRVLGDKSEGGTGDTRINRSSQKRSAVLVSDPRIHWNGYHGEGNEKSKKDVIERSIMGGKSCWPRCTVGAKWKHGQQISENAFRTAGTAWTHNRGAIRTRKGGPDFAVRRLKTGGDKGMFDEV